VTRPHVPEAVLTAAHDRARARADHDWAEADRLRAEIESAGWRIVDRGTDFALSPIAPPDLDEGDGRIKYGASDKVPARLGEPAAGLATVVVIATDHPDDVARTVTGIRDHAPEGTSVVIVADAPSDAQAQALEGWADDRSVEVVWTSDRLGHATATNMGIRRAAAPIVILLDASVEPAGDFVTPLVHALDDPTVAVTGGWGITSADLRHFDDAPAGDVDAIEGYCQAFRRADYVERGPLDERFRFYRNLDIWWSLVLRDGGEGEPSRRAVRLADLPLTRHEHRGWASLPDDERDRQSKRNFYRIIDRFGWRRDLLISAATDGDGP
jgi:hypothetical protein